MNIVNKSVLILTATLTAALTPIQSHADMFGGSGQYVMMPWGKDGAGVWIMDTETGKVRFCVEGFLTTKPECSPWSVEAPYKSK